MEIEENIRTVAVDAVGYITSLSIDILFLAGVFLLLLAFGLRTSKGHLTGLIFSIYVALLIVPLFPYSGVVNIAGQAVLGRFDLGALIVYVGFIILSFVAIRRAIDYDWESTRLQKLHQGGLLAFVSTALFAYGAYKTSLIDGFVNTTPIDSLFTTPGFFFWWIFISLVAVFISMR